MALHQITIAFPEGWRGENTDWPPDMLAGGLSATLNVAHVGPELQKRAGQFREPSAQVSAGVSVVAGFTADYSTGQKFIIQTDDGRFYQSSGTMHTWAGMGTSGYGTPATFVLLGDVTLIATNSGTMLGTSGADNTFSLASSAPSARFLTTFKGRALATGHDASADEVRYTAVGATTGLPTVADWLTSNNAGNRLFSQGEGSRIVGIAAGRDEWYVFKPQRTYVVTGQTPTSFVTSIADREVGFYHRTVAVVGRGLVGANEEGVFSLLDGKIEPLLDPADILYWRSLNHANTSAFAGAWVASKNQYRVAIQDGSTWKLLAGVLEVGKKIAWYRWDPPARCIFTRRVAGKSYDFYRGGNADGYLYRMDQGTQDASASITSYAQTGIHDGGAPWVDKKFTRAWVYARTRGSWNLSCTFTVHSEDGKPAQLGPQRVVSLATVAGDVKRATIPLDDARGWGIDLKVTMDPDQAASIHKVIIEYDDMGIGHGAPA